MRGMLARLPRGMVLLSIISASNVGLGFIREAVIAFRFGASAELDSFLVAYTIPRLVAIQAVQITVSIILPIYVGYTENGQPERANALLRGWIRFVAKLLTVLCLGLVVFADLVTRGIGPGLSDEATADAARWLRYLTPYIWVMGLTGCFKVVLDSRRRFAIPAVSSGISSVAMIAAAAIGAPYHGVGVLVPALVVAGIVAFAVQWWPASRHEPRLLDLRGLPSSVHLPLLGGGIMVLTALAQQTNAIVDRAFASYLSEGSIAALGFASAVADIPTTVLSMALATALFPVLAKLVANNAHRVAFRTTVNWAMIVLAVGAIPVAILVFMREEVVALLFGRGAFDADDVHKTATALMILAFTIFTTGTASIVNRLLLSQRQLLFMFLITLFAITVKIVANALLVFRYGLAGLAAGTVIAGVLATLARYLVAWRGSLAAEAEMQ